MRQISLVRHHAFMEIGPAVLPIVVHRDQNIRKYSITDHQSVSSLKSFLIDETAISKDHRPNDR